MTVQGCKLKARLKTFPFSKKKPFYKERDIIATIKQNCCTDLIPVKLRINPTSREKEKLI